MEIVSHLRVIIPAERLIIVVFNGWTKDAGVAMMKATGSIHNHMKKYTTCSLPKVPCEAGDLEPDKGSSKYSGPPPGVTIPAAPALAARALNATNEQD